MHGLCLSSHQWHKLETAVIHQKRLYEEYLDKFGANLEAACEVDLNDDNPIIDIPSEALSTYLAFFIQEIRITVCTKSYDPDAL